MGIYIRSYSMISPQPSFEQEVEQGDNESPGNGSGQGFRKNFEQYADYSVREHTGNRLSCIEPDYKSLLDPKLLRRMSRIIRMGSAAAMKCLLQSGTSCPDAITTGTAYGCLEDTGNFLAKMIRQNEELLTPTAFIQSTHNTVGAQIALMLNCHGYNNTFVHRGFSFESALLDAMMLLQEGEAVNVLAGSIDELTDMSFDALSKFSLYRKVPVSNLRLFEGSYKGTIAGEGAAFFLLQKDASNAMAKIDGIQSFYKPSSQEAIEQQLVSFLGSHFLQPEDIDLLILGKNGDCYNDDVYTQLYNSLFKEKETANYKHLCGEYPTSTSFALGHAIAHLSTHKRVLIYNHYQHVHHSLILLSAC